jgi:D-xylose 1-dehydrogenase (NADP+, D-xylono-1,5-lactone-forming)
MGVAWGLLSTAEINRKVIAGAAKSDKVDIVAVGSRDQAKAEAYAAEHGIERAHGSYDALLEDPGVEAIYIGLPNSMHVEWSIRALDAGKHVLVEKPFDRTPAEVERAFDAAEAADRFLMEAFMYRHNPQTLKVQELVEDGAIGELRLIRTHFSFTLTELGNVRMLPELAGGALMDVGCYCVSGQRMLAGEPETVVAQQIPSSTGVDVRFAAALTFPGNVLGHFDCGFDSSNRSGLEAAGPDGSLVVRDPWHCNDPGIELRRDGKPTEVIPVDPADSYQLELENLSDAIRGDASPLLGRADALGQARAIDALYRSAETGERVEL